MLSGAGSKLDVTIKWASGGMVYTLVLEASAERIESSSLSLPTKIWGISSAGRAAALQAVSRRFEPCILHQSFV